MLWESSIVLDDKSNRNNKATNDSKQWAQTICSPFFILLQIAVPKGEKNVINKLCEVYNWNKSFSFTTSEVRVAHRAAEFPDTKMLLFKIRQKISYLEIKAPLFLRADISLRLQTRSYSKFLLLLPEGREVGHKDTGTPRRLPCAQHRDVTASPSSSRPNTGFVPRY